MTTRVGEAPWLRLPKGLAGVLSPRAGQIRADILRELDADPAWTERMQVPKVRADLSAVTGAVVAGFLELVGTSAPTFGEADRARFREVGAGEAREGRGLEDLLSAYRIGTRVMYAEFARALSGLDPSPAAQVALGEAVLALIDALQAESAEGYAHEVATHTGERERRLRRLVEALLAGDEDTTRAVAAQVGWKVPESVVVVLLPQEALPDARAVLSARGPVVERDGLAVAILASGRWLEPAVHRLARSTAPAGLPGPRVGPAVPLREAHRSWTTAHLLDSAADEGPLWATDRLPALLLRGVPDVAVTLIARMLEPFASLRTAQRERLIATLAAWLRHWGQRTEVAAELSIHPQTVAYRVNQLRDLLGGAMDDPAWRLEMQLALLTDGEPPDRAGRVSGLVPVGGRRDDPLSSTILQQGE